jgi:hypothetical protein
MQRRRRPALTALGLVLAGLASLMLMSADPAGADVIHNNNLALTSLWTYYQGANCVAENVAMEQTSYPTESWETGVAAAYNSSGGYSWSVTIKGYLTLTYTPSSMCKSAWYLNSYDFATHGESYFWNGRQWVLCEVNPPGVYGSYWWSYGGVTWGQKVTGGIGREACGTGWYATYGYSLAWENGAWVGSPGHYQISAAQNPGYFWGP